MSVVSDPSDPAATPLAEVMTSARTLGTALIIGGAIGVICGLVVIIWTKITLLALAIVAGINLVLLGALGIVRAFQRDLDAGGKALSGVLGLFGVLAGVAVIRRPGQTLLVIVIALGLWMLASGIVELVRALLLPGPRGIALLTAAVDVIFGILILSWPKISLGTLAVVAGIAFVIRGALMIVAGVGVRRAVAQPEPGSP